MFSAIGALIKFFVTLFVTIFIFFMLIFSAGIAYGVYKTSSVIETNGVQGIIHQIWCGKNGCKSDHS